MTCSTDVRRLSKITTDGHGQPSDGASGGGGGGHAGAGTPGHFSQSPWAIDNLNGLKDGSPEAYVKLSISIYICIYICL